MGLLHLRNRILFLLTAVRITVSTFNGTEKDIIHAIAGNPFRIRSWSMIGSTLYITIKKDNILILQMSMGIGHDRNSTVQKGRMIPIYNQATQELSVLFQNISKEDGGIYEMKESFYRTDIGNEAISDEPEVDTYDIRYDTWLLEIYVLDPSDIRHTYVGESISMESKRSIPHSTLYNYDKLGAFLTGSPCSVLTDSFLFERLRCANDHSGSMYNITIENVSQRDAGLYKITAGEKETEIYLFEIKDSPICAVVGDNLTFGWFYNQQGIQRTLRVIHPNQGIMLLLHQTNSPNIKHIFQHRILYSGDILQSYMSFTLLNVNLYDAGLYTIETLHGNTIPGSKELIVNGVPYQVVLPVITAMAVVILALIVNLIWIQHRKRSTLKADRFNSTVECDNGLYITPIGGESFPPIPLMNVGHKAESKIAENAHDSFSMRLLQTNQSFGNYGYEPVNISSKVHIQGACNTSERIYETTETSDPSIHSSFYLTVMGVLETSV
ncbi:hypothetical protein ACJMK2_031735 [Sinanodonta woodiana]|uniref:Uncharacterized protein n=1 Tax=Sinanodonta woodiana TaxID=1069815 RepID=A0ABD3WZN6_SINWO